MANTSDELAKLGDLLDRGLITRDEFNRLKLDLLQASDSGSQEAEHEAVSPYQLVLEPPVSESFTPETPDQLGQERLRDSQVVEAAKPKSPHKSRRPFAWVAAAIVTAAAIGIGALLVLAARDGSRPTTVESLAREACATDGDLAAAKAVLVAGFLHLSSSEQHAAIDAVLKKCPSWMKTIVEAKSAGLNEVPAQTAAPTLPPTPTDLLSDGLLDARECVDTRTLLVKRQADSEVLESSCSILESLGSDLCARVESAGDWDAGFATFKQYLEAVNTARPKAEAEKLAKVAAVVASAVCLDLF